jgi:hypothetical protein
MRLGRPDMIDTNLAVFFLLVGLEDNKKLLSKDQQIHTSTRYQVLNEKSNTHTTSNKHRWPSLLRMSGFNDGDYLDNAICC